MKLEAPPSRYRVVERGGRLVVIDSQSGAMPLKAKDLVPDTVAFAAEPQAAPELSLDSAMASAPPPPPMSPRSPIAQPPGALRNVAETITGDHRDRDGRLIFVTARWYEAKGPRTLALSKAGEEKVGGAILALVGAAIVALLFLLFGDVGGWIIVFAALLLLGRAKPLTTAWIDKLAAS